LAQANPGPDAAAADAGFWQSTAAGWLLAAGCWLQSINPGVPAAPSVPIPQTMNCSYFRTGFTCR